MGCQRSCRLLLSRWIRQVVCLAQVFMPWHDVAVLL